MELLSHEKKPSLRKSLPSSVSVCTLESDEEERYLKLNMVEKISTLSDITKSTSRKLKAKSNLYDFLSCDIPVEENPNNNNKLVEPLSLRSQSFWYDILTMEFESTF